MPTRKYHVLLTSGERDLITEMMQMGQLSSEARKRAEICLALDETERTPLPIDKIAQLYGVSALTVTRHRERFSHGNVVNYITRKPRIYEDTVILDVTIFSIYITLPPYPMVKWTASTIQEKLKEFDKDCSVETVRRRINTYRDHPYYGKVVEHFDSLDYEHRKEFLANDKYNNIVRNMVYHYWATRKTLEAKPVIESIDINRLLSLDYKKVSEFLEAQR
jgi:hypothetical protein